MGRQSDISSEVLNGLLKNGIWLSLELAIFIEIRPDGYLLELIILKNATLEKNMSLFVGVSLSSIIL